MSSSGSDIIRLTAALSVSALMIGAIMKPSAPKEYAERAADFAPERASLADKSCPIAGAALDGPFANIDDVISVLPLGGVTAPGEPLPAPHIRINTRKGETVFERRITNALAPARADITAIERRIKRDAQGNATGQSWRVKLQLCEKLTAFYDDLDSIDEDILRRAGGIKALQEISGPDHVATTTLIRVKSGDIIGAADGFDISVEDKSAAPENLVRPERYRSNPYIEARILHTDATLVKALQTDHTRAQCPLDYLPAQIGDQWKKLLGDSFGMRRAKGDDACRTALVDQPGTAQGAWFTDAAHNGATTRVSAVALAPDNINPDRLIFALHGRLPSLTPEMVALPPKSKEARRDAARDFLSFTGSDEGFNRRFDMTANGGIYCYERLRANFVGPRINGILLLELEKNEDGADIMRLEAKGDTLSCADLGDEWAFTTAHTVFYR